jgi:NAD(P)-dependent dehydrogenase (short-subunit alcohol dehydrogenase family)
MKNVVMISITSDIGAAMARRYVADGHRVIGSYRTAPSADAHEALSACELHHCDLADAQSMTRFADLVAAAARPWDQLVFCAGDPLPLQSFFECDFDAWHDSVEVNCLAPLRLLHALYPLRRRATSLSNGPTAECTTQHETQHETECAIKRETRSATANMSGPDAATGSIPTVVFFAGGGMNNAVRNFSAYTVSKVMLAKTCELIAHEFPDLRIVIVGPGWVRTKIHDRILEHVAADDPRAAQTRDFLSETSGTDPDAIYDMIAWLARQDPALVSGRNFSVVHDAWQQGATLLDQLAADPDALKLRRRGDPHTQHRQGTSTA